MQNNPLILLLLLFLFPLHVFASQGLPEVRVYMTTDSIVYSGPGTNAGYLEYVAKGREFVAAGRNSDTSWIQINIDGQIEGWVAVETITTEGDLNTLVVRSGLLSAGNGPYPVDSPLMRAAEVQIILVTRPMRLIAARWTRLQGYQSASCQAIPSAPAPPSFTPAQIAAAPELETVQRELTWIQEQVELAILIYQEVCKGGTIINQELYTRGIGHINPAYGVYTNLRKYMNELTGLTAITN